MEFESRPTQCPSLRNRPQLSPRRKRVVRNANPDGRRNRRSARERHLRTCPRIRIRRSKRRSRRRRRPRRWLRMEESRSTVGTRGSPRNDPLAIRRSAIRHLERSEKSLFGGLPKRREEFFPAWHYRATRTAGRREIQTAAGHFSRGNSARSTVCGNSRGGASASLRAAPAFPGGRTRFFPTASRWHRVFRGRQNDSLAQHQRTYIDRCGGFVSREKCAGRKIFAARARDISK